MNNIFVLSLTKEWDRRLMERKWVQISRATFSKSLEETTKMDSPWSKVFLSTEDPAFFSRDVVLFTSQEELEREKESLSVDASVDQILLSSPSVLSREVRRILQDLPIATSQTDSPRREETTSLLISTLRKLMMSAGMWTIVPSLEEIRPTTKHQESRDLSQRNASEERRSLTKLRKSVQRPPRKLPPSTRSSSHSMSRSRRLPEKPLRRQRLRLRKQRRMPRNESLVSTSSKIHS